MLKRLIKIVLLIGLVFALGVGAIAFFAWQRYDGFADAPMAGIDPGETLVVEPGDSLPKVLRTLRERGVEVDALHWRMLAKSTGAAGKIQVGEYALEPGMTPRTLLERMRDGKVLSYRFTIVEGWNIRDLRGALAKASPLKQTTADMDDAALMRALGRGGEHPEGRFLPETYLYTRTDTDLDVLKRAATAMDKAVAEAWKGRDEGLPLRTPYELQTLASIVEKETGIASERPEIAGVFVRRLKVPMRLETDPTVIYGMGSQYAGNIRKADLRTDTPYNTYTRDGLPPTPIAMPGRDALQATAHPADGDALFFVAVGDGSGRHVFTRTYGEHQTAVAEYIKRYRQQQSSQQQSSQQQSSQLQGSEPQAKTQ
ncbi:MAG: endolytic transglycosylase MltG [Xanthomonadaceae bacterium]|nr:endolytic transglycosylase MltG [Xanthomonadaceae bacterium]